MERLRKIRLILAGCWLTQTAGCGSSSSDGGTRLDGFRYKVSLVRAADEATWTEVKGTQEWWFFSANAFRQISTGYVEPQFYGEQQACGGTASGSWNYGESSEKLPSNQKIVTLSYDGSKDTVGLCRHTDRSLRIILQPSGAVDLLDTKRFQRLEVMEKIQ